MAAPKLKSFLFVDMVGTNAWINEVAKKTGFEDEEEIEGGWGSLYYEDDLCDIRFTINRREKQVVIWPYLQLLEPNREILNHANDERLTGNMTTDEFVDFCLRIKEIFKQQKVNKKLKEMRKDFAK